MIKPAIEFTGKFFQNNGHLRGALYFTAAALTGITNAFTHWADVPPKNYYEITAEVLGAFAAGVVAVRAYLDTHLSRGDHKQNETTSQTAQPANASGVAGLPDDGRAGR